ncbi:MAG: LytTR family DNA-binding domain-containing protein [Oscillospiraceae bacterium]
MRIAICDDDSSELSRISSLLNAYRLENDVKLTYKTYLSAAELLSTMKCNQYDLLLLDILMPGFSGIDAAREVRGFDSSVNIIFLTSSPEFALESYSVKARDYMLKPVSKEKLFSTLNIIFNEEKPVLDGLSVKTQNGMARILFAKLAFVEVVNKRLHFHISDGSVREVCAPLSEYEEKLLSRPEFIKVHRSYIVNMEQMCELTSNGFISHNGSTVPISRLLYSQVRRTYMDHLFAEAKVL